MSANLRRANAALSPILHPALRDGDDTLESLQLRRERLFDAIRAGQSTDDMGPAVNRAILEAERSCFDALAEVDAKIAAILASKVSKAEGDER